MYNCIALQKCSTFKNSEINTKEIKRLIQYASNKVRIQNIFFNITHFGTIKTKYTDNKSKIILIMTYLNSSA